MTSFQEHKKIKEMNRSLEQEISTEAALKKARTLGAFHMKNIVFYHNKIWLLAQIKTIKKEQQESQTHDLD